MVERRVEVEMPEALGFLEGNIVGERFRCFRSNVHGCDLQVVLGQIPSEPHLGMFVSLEKRKGMLHEGPVWERCEGELLYTGSAWDNRGDTGSGHPMAFEDWVRWTAEERVAAHLSACTLEVLDGLNPNLSAENCMEKRGELERRCREILEAADRFDGLVHCFASAARAVILGLRAVETPLAEGEVRELEENLLGLGGGQNLLGGWFSRVLARNGLFSLLPETVAESIAPALLSRVEEGTNAMIDEWQKARSSERFGDFLRAVEQMGGIFNGRACAPLEEAHRAVDRTDRTEEESYIAERIQTYNRLRSDFAAGRPRAANPEKAGQELLAVETELNAYWKQGPYREEEIASEVRGRDSLLPTRDTLNAQARRRAVQEGRFLSSGTAGYMGWLRNLGRYEEAVSVIYGQLKDLEMSALRFESHPYAFDCLVNNGLGNFLDSGNEDHIALALELVDGLETVVHFETGNALYPITCVLARAGQIERAVDCAERAVLAGNSALHMAHDADLAAIAEHPRFVALLGDFARKTG